MTWEIVSGLIVLLGAFVSVVNVVVRVNRTMVSLEKTVQSLKEYIEKQDRKNDHFYRSLNILDKRVTLIEKEIFEPLPGIKEERGIAVERNI